MKKGNRMIVFLVMLRLFAGLSAAGDIEITDSGIYPIKRLDTGMTFSHPIDWRPRGNPTAREKQRNSGMANFANIHRKYIFQYLHDRRGECEIGITYNADGSSNLLRQKISFDTYVSNQSVPDILKEYYEANEVKRCASVDEDSLDSCQPVKCLVKYSGKRNFFNKSLRRCQPVVVWVPDSSEAADSNIICHNGRQDNVTGMCICEEGWGTHQIDSLESSTESIHMCNFKTSPFSRVTNTGYSTISLVILVPPRFELGLLDSKSNVMPLHYGTVLALELHLNIYKHQHTQYSACKKSESTVLHAVLRNDTQSDARLFFSTWRWSGAALRFTTDIKQIFV
ncbi:hypothetical protein KQX54_021073 [Cotesia glomerata]|uniref:Uncharacterized protein n=1 Tax=Cotesia glomerata TaxID=32391 RepID=A0AAV7HMK9_COTGL|nr:hypothetical protein KQX54_021073 [Cotesia glomerata]